MTTKQALTAQIDAELEELIPGYLQNRQREIPTLFHALQQRDFESLRQAGHTLKGSGYGFEPINTLGKALEEAANAQSTQEIEHTLQQLKEYVFHVRVEYV
jgi:HPt (histidine-containing phosphotransfer) domain-containing protein